MGRQGETYTLVLNALGRSERPVDIARSLNITAQRVYQVISLARERGELPREYVERDHAYTYFVRVGAFIQIGRAKDLQILMHGFKRHLPPKYEAQLLGAEWCSDAEGQTLVMSLHATRVGQSAWVHATPQLLRQIEKICSNPSR